MLTCLYINSVPEPQINSSSEDIISSEVSSEIEEMLRTCNRMAVLRDGEKVGELTADEMSQEGVMHAIAGGGASE